MATSTVSKYNDISAYNLIPNGIDTREMNGVYTPNQIVQTGLVYSYDPANPSSYAGTGTTIYDLKGSGDMTLYGGVESSYDQNGWFNFDDVNDAIYRTGVTTISGDQSLGGWYRVTGDNDFYQMFAGILGSGLEGIQVYYNCAGTNESFFSRIEDGLGNPEAVRIDPVVFTPSFNTWYYVCGAWDNTSHTITHYVFDSGGLVGTVSQTDLTVDTTNTTSANIIMGDGTYRAYGDVGEMHIYNEVLSQADFTTNYNNTKARYGY